MRIQKIASNILKNRVFLNALEKISEHGISFSAGTSLLLSGIVRPASISFTPDTDKENKQYAISNSICSALVKFGIVEAVALPLENAVKYIDKNPQILKNETINNLSPRAYKFITQTIKLSAGLLTAIPKSVLTVALIPVIMGNLFNSSNNKTQNGIKSQANNEINFTGNIDKYLAKGIGKIIDNKRVQEFALKYETKDNDIAKHMTALTDILLTASGVQQVNNSKNIKDNRKRALNLNNIISTVITITGGYGIDSLLKSNNDRFIEKFSRINANNPKLPKYIEGINILRPALIFAGIYYGILPIFSTYISDKIDKYLKIKT